MNLLECINEVLNNKFDSGTLEIQLNNNKKDSNGLKTQIDLYRFMLKYFNNKDSSNGRIISKFITNEVEADKMRTLLNHYNHYEFVDKNNIQFDPYKETTPLDPKNLTLNSEELVVFINYLFEYKIFDNNNVLPDIKKAILISHLTGYKPEILRRKFSSKNIKTSSNMKIISELLTKLNINIKSELRENIN